MKTIGLFDYTDYKDYVRDKVKHAPDGGHGMWKKLSQHIGVHTTLMSQVFRGSKNLGPEQILTLSEFFGLNESEKEYFMTLAEKSRSGSHKLDQYYVKKIKHLQKQAQDYKNRLPRGKTLSQTSKSTFYSQWYYSAIRLLTSLNSYQSAENISQRLKLPLYRTREVLNFLVENNLCIEENGHFKVAANRTHIEKESPLANRHHSNWRQRAMESYETLGETETSFTAPLTISKDDALKIRSILMGMVDEVSKVVKKTDPEELYCLNIDWFIV